MDFIVPTPEQGHFGLRAMKAVALADGAIHASETAMLHAAMELSGAHSEIESLEDITPEELAAGLVDPALRRQLLSALVLMSMADQDPHPGEVACIDRFARALEADHDMVGTLRRLSKGHLRRARLDIVRRFWARDRVVEQLRERGLRGLWELVQSLRRTHRDPEISARYRALGALPEGSLGRGYFDELSGNEFAFPGELGAGPEFIAYHDMTHVLGDYGTSPAEEVLIGFFSAGFRRENPMTFALLVMFQLHLGLATAPGQPTHEGFFEPHGAVEALRRGAAMSVDLSGDWDYWAVIDRPVDELRAEYGIAPRVRSA